MALTPTQRTLKAQREMGRLPAVAEKYVRAGGFGFRKDLFGIIDVVSLDPEKGIIGIQSCGQNFAAHKRELLEGTERYRDTGLTKPEACIEWLKAGGKLELWGWRKAKVKRGGKAMIWEPRVEELTLEML